MSCTATSQEMIASKSLDTRKSSGKICCKCQRDGSPTDIHFWPVPTIIRITDCHGSPPDSRNCLGQLYNYCFIWEFVYLKLMLFSFFKFSKIIINSKEEVTYKTINPWSLKRPCKVFNSIFFSVRWFSSTIEILYCVIYKSERYLLIGWCFSFKLWETHIQFFNLTVFCIQFNIVNHSHTVMLLFSVMYFL